MSRGLSHKISFCMGVYNEENELRKGVKRITNGLTKILGDGRYELIIINNGSTDKTPEILSNIEKKNVIIGNIAKKGLGLALKVAIKKAKYEHIVLSAIDLPFGFSDLKNVNKTWKGYDIVFGSKAHPESKINNSLKRKIYSFFYRKFLKVLFNLKIRDTQGSIFLKKSKILSIMKYCDADNAFFTAQLAIYGNYAGLNMSEVAVSMNGEEDRKSKFNLLKDGKDMFTSMFIEYLKLRRFKKKHWQSKLPAPPASTSKSSA